MTISDNNAPKNMLNIAILELNLTSTAIAKIYKSKCGIDKYGSPFAFVVFEDIYGKHIKGFLFNLAEADQYAKYLQSLNQKPVEIVYEVCEDKEGSKYLNLKSLKEADNSCDDITKMFIQEDVQTLTYINDLKSVILTENTEVSDFISEYVDYNKLSKFCSNKIGDGEPGYILRVLLWTLNAASMCTLESKIAFIVVVSQYCNTYLEAADNTDSLDFIFMGLVGQAFVKAYKLPLKTIANELKYLSTMFIKNPVDISTNSKLLFSLYETFCIYSRHLAKHKYMPKDGSIKVDNYQLWSVE